MSASFYTSFETSVALREAGAPQRPARHVPTVCMMESHICWNKDGSEKPWLGPWIGDDFSVRAMRLDEILAALASELEAPKCVRLEVFFDGSAFVGRVPGVPVMIGSSPVEAAAACWLACLRAAREVKP